MAIVIAGEWMMRVICETCDRVLADFTDMKEMLASYCHVSQEKNTHYAHKLRIVEDADDKSGDRTLDVEMKCLQGCGERFQGKVSKWMLAAVTIAYHSRHEGHRFAIWINGIEVSKGVGLGIGKLEERDKK